MAKMRTYVVSFSPAERNSWGGYTVKLSLMVGNSNHEVNAASLPDLEREVRRLAAEYGQTCSPYVRLKDKRERSPNGFDAWSRGLDIIEIAQQEAA